MKILKTLLLSLLFTCLFCSCESTRVYVKSQSLFYDNDYLVEERGTVSEDQKEVENYVKTYYDFSDKSIITEKENSNPVVHYFVAEKEKTSKKKYDVVTFSLIETPQSKKQSNEPARVLGHKKVKYKKNSFKSLSNTIKLSKSDKELYAAVEKDLLVQLNKSGSDEEYINNSLKLRTENSTEKITVISNTNGSYIAYSFLGKPFVIIGASAWNVLRCFGYAVLNFMGGYAFFDGYSDTLWMMPSYSDSKMKADIAKEANRIKYYPEYHIPFTNNHIIIDRYNRDIEVKKIIGENAEDITAVEHFEYDNTMSVTLSAKTDAASTAAIAGVAGTVITIPVSGTSWVMGFVAAVANSVN